MLHLLKSLFLLGIINMILWKLIEIFMMERRELWKISENQRSAKHTFALEIVHNRTGTCHKILRVTLGIIIMYSIMFHICSWDGDMVWARPKVILVKGDTLRFKLCLKCH